MTSPFPAPHPEPSRTFAARARRRRIAASLLLGVVIGVPLGRFVVSPTIAAHVLEDDDRG